MTHTVLMLCECNNKLVVKHGNRIDMNFGQVTMYEDTGRVIAACRRCQRIHTLDPGNTDHRRAEAFGVLIAARR